MFRKFVGFAARVIARAWPEVRKPLGEIVVALAKAVRVEWWTIAA